MSYYNRKEYYNKTQLKERGWTESIIKKIVERHRTYWVLGCVQICSTKMLFNFTYWRNWEDGWIQRIL